MDHTPRFLNPNEEIGKHGADLPHWQQNHSTYFITFRLADSIPKVRLNRWREERAIWLQVHPEPWSAIEEEQYHKRFSQSIEQWLDAGEGECLLAKAGIAEEIFRVFLEKNDSRYHQHSFIIMPNHAHILVSLGEGELLQSLIKIWKGVSSRRANALLGRSGEIWQTNYFDRLIRDSGHFWNCARYIRKNPIKACLRGGGYVLHESPMVRTTLDAAALTKE